MESPEEQLEKHYLETAKSNGGKFTIDIQNQEFVAANVIAKILEAGKIEMVEQIGTLITYRVI